MRKAMRATSALFCVAVVGCGTEHPKNSVGARVEPLPDAVPGVTAPLAIDVSGWKVSPRGIGPLRAGMTLAEVQSQLVELNGPPDLASAACTYARGASLPAGAVLMFGNGKLERIDVLTGRLKTELGAGVGDREEDVKLLYGSALSVSPHKYTEGHYLTVAGDSAHRIVFETDGERVLRYRSGRLPAVEYVEGCG